MFVAAHNNVNKIPPSGSNRPVPTSVLASAPDASDPYDVIVAREPLSFPNPHPCFIVPTTHCTEKSFTFLNSSTYLVNRERERAPLAAWLGRPTG